MDEPAAVALTVAAWVVIALHVWQGRDRRAILRRVRRERRRPGDSRRAAALD
ncbi:hypothetical protein [Nocardioides lijunqiniae]|uniref:hypothetical protein n=1 Tax=Nocardioides lijunqiniae TaxID=2760832 RepID=UPI001878E409|nr:hypothetical protein [Nocardioides lijunqiniae]